MTISTLVAQELADTGFSNVFGSNRGQTKANVGYTDGRDQEASAGFWEMAECFLEYRGNDSKMKAAIRDFYRRVATFAEEDILGRGAIPYDDPAALAILDAHTTVPNRLNLREGIDAVFVFTGDSYTNREVKKYYTMLVALLDRSHEHIRLPKNDSERFSLSMALLNNKPIPENLLV